MTVRECVVIGHVRKEVMSAWREETGRRREAVACTSDRKRTRGRSMYFRQEDDKRP
jgi:Zn ribbon nucleic-acid-binding protein